MLHNDNHKPANRRLNPVSQVHISSFLTQNHKFNVTYLKISGQIHKFVQDISKHTVTIDTTGTFPFIHHPDHEKNPL